MLFHDETKFISGTPMVVRRSAKKAKHLMLIELQQVISLHTS